MICGSHGGAAHLRPTHGLLPLRAPLGCPSSGQPPRHPAPLYSLPQQLQPPYGRSLPAGRGAHTGAEAAWPRAPRGTFLPRHAQAPACREGTAVPTTRAAGERPQGAEGPSRAASRASPPPPGLPLTWAADRGLDPRLLQHRHPVDGPFDVLAEHVPVQVEEAESKLVQHLGRRDLPVTPPVGGAASPQVSDGWSGPHSCPQLVPPSPPISRACLPSGPPALPLTVAMASAWRPPSPPSSITLS